MLWFRGTRFVLRKKPAGGLLLPTAHRVESEYEMLSALHKYNTKLSTPPDRKIPIPEPVLLCKDSSIIGTPFYVMEFLEGRIFTDMRMPEISPKDRRECWLAAVRTLVALGQVIPAEIGLSNFAASTDYFPRQIKRFSRTLIDQAVVVDIDTKKPIGDIPHSHELIAWYKDNYPNESRTGSRIVHGDYKVDNLIYHPTENKVIGILDWELCTLGNPLADFGNLTLQWSVDKNDLPDGVTSLRAFKGTSPDSPITLEELELEYCSLTGQPRPMDGIIFVRSWTIFKLAVISQGIAARFARRQASSDDAWKYGKTFPLLGYLAWRVLDVEGIKLDSKKAKL
ncbi:hypothetical protein AX15_003376 [Amanita polypyramis BW_CC]|nr:hypothetical protein AX15_003376 [Amanita polypyramis BW_CC]